MAFPSLAIALVVLLASVAGAPAQQRPAPDRAPTLGGKLQPYIGCINRHSARIHDSEARYKSWVGKQGPTGRERIIYGLYTIYDTKDCRLAVENAAKSQPPHAGLEKAGADYAAAIGKIEPMLKTADDYYGQQNYKDDKFARGKEMHPRLLAAWDEFRAADTALREVVRTLNDDVQAAELASVEQREGKKLRWHVLTVMAKAKELQRVEGGAQDKIDLAKVTPALEAYEASVKALEDYAGANSGEKLGSFFLKASKDYLATAKGLMRRLRDKTRYSQGETMLLRSGSGGWMVEGSPQRLLRDYNQLIDRFNAGPQI